MIYVRFHTRFVYRMYLYMYTLYSYSLSFSLYDMITFTSKISERNTCFPEDTIVVPLCRTEVFKLLG